MTRGTASKLAMWSASTNWIKDKWGVAIRILMHNNPGIYSGT